MNEYSCPNCGAPLRCLIYEDNQTWYDIDPNTGKMRINQDLNLYVDGKKLVCSASCSDLRALTNWTAIVDYDDGTFSWLDRPNNHKQGWYLQTWHMNTGANVIGPFDTQDAALAYVVDCLRVEANTAPNYRTTFSAPYEE